MRRLACLVKVYLVGGGNYARFLKFRSPVLIGVLEVFERVGGLTRFYGARTPPMTMRPSWVGYPA